MIEATILIFAVWMSIVGLMTFLFFGEGTKGIEKDPYYVRKTGKLYTASKTREKHIV